MLKSLLVFVFLAVQSPAAPPSAPSALFITPDPPTVVAATLNADGTISITFSKPMDPSTINERTVTLGRVPGPSPAADAVPIVVP